MEEKFECECLLSRYNCHLWKLLSDRNWFNSDIRESGTGRNVLSKWTFSQRLLLRGSTHPPSPAFMDTEGHSWRWRRLKERVDSGQCHKFTYLRTYLPTSVTSKKSPNVFKSCPKMISLEKIKILTPLQILLKNVRDLGKLIVPTGFEKVTQSPINCPNWSHCYLPTTHTEWNISSFFGLNWVMHWSRDYWIRTMSIQITC